MREIVEHLASFVIMDDRAYGNLDLQVLAIVAMTITAFPMAPPASSKRVGEPEFQKRVFMGVGDEINAAAVSTISATGTAARDELLPAKGDAAMPAVTCFDCDFGFVDERS
jgi:hypothetical protein